MVKFIKWLLGPYDQLDAEPLRIAKVVIDGRSLVTIFKGLQKGKLITLEGLPTDAKAVGVTVDHYYPNRILLFIESNKFNLVNSGHEIPFMDPLIIHTKVRDNARNND